MEQGLVHDNTHSGEHWVESRAVCFAGVHLLSTAQWAAPGLWAGWAGWEDRVTTVLSMDVLPLRLRRFLIFTVLSALSLVLAFYWSFLEVFNHMFNLDVCQMSVLNVLLLLILFTEIHCIFGSCLVRLFSCFHAVLISCCRFALPVCCCMVFHQWHLCCFAFWPSSCYFEGFILLAPD